MIVYYDVESGEITGFSRILVEGRNESYAYLNDPVAEKIFNGEEKVSKYRVVLKNPVEKIGSLVVKKKTSNEFELIDSRLHLIKKDIDQPQVLLEHNLSNNTITLKISDELINWWKEDVYFNKKRIFIAACKLNDPYVPLWIRSFSFEDIENNLNSFQCLNRRFSLYTNKFFSSYSYCEVQ
jgi:hypothetical protein